MSRVWERAGSTIRKRLALVAVVALVGTVALAFGLPMLAFRTSQDTMVSPSSQVYRNDVLYQGLFGGEVMVVIYHGDVRQLFSPANRAALAKLDDQLGARSDIHAVVSPLDAANFAAAQLPIAPGLALAALGRDQAAAAAAAIRQSAASGGDATAQTAASAAARAAVAAAFAARTGPDGTRLAAAGTRSLDNPKFLDFVLFDAHGNIRPSLTGVLPDSDNALLVATLRGNLSISQSSTAAAAVERIARATPLQGFAATVTGSAQLEKAVDDGTRKGIATTGAFAVLVMALILLLVFRARWRVLVLPVVLLGTAWSFGAFGYLGIPLTMVTISGLPILIGLGVDFAIQVHSRYEEEIGTSGDAGALERALQGIGPALTIAMIGAIVGFLALLLSQVPMVRDFGVMLAVGTAMLLVAVLAVLPATLAARDRHGARKIPKPRSGRLERSVGWLTSVRAHPALVVVVALLIVLAGGTALRRTPVQSDPEKFVPGNSAAVRGLNQLQSVAGSTGDIGFLIEGDAQRADVLAWMAGYERQELARHPGELIQSNSVASTVAQVTGSTATPGDVRAVMAVAPAGIKATLESSDGHTAQIEFAVGNLSLDREKTLLTAMQSDLHPPPGVAVVPSGLSVIGIATVDAMRNNESTMALVALVAVFFWLLLRLRSPRKAFLVVLPVVTAVGLASLLVYLVGVQVSVLGALSSPIVIAIATEFSVLVMERYGEERRRGHGPDEAMAIASHRIGRAFTTSGLTTAGGFAVLALSGFPLLSSFGLIVAVSVLAALLCALVMLPPLLVWSERESVGREPVEAFAPRAEASARPRAS